MMNDDLTPQILRRAYEIWESEGRPHGRDKLHWFLAKAELVTGDRQPEAGASRSKRKSRSAAPRPGTQRNR